MIEELAITTFKVMGLGLFVWLACFVWLKTLDRLVLALEISYAVIEVVLNNRKKCRSKRDQ